LNFERRIFYLLFHLSSRERNVIRAKHKTHIVLWPNPRGYMLILKIMKVLYYQTGSCHKRQKPQAPTPQAPIRNRQTRKVANAKGLNRNTNLT